MQICVWVYIKLKICRCAYLILQTKISASFIHLLDTFFRFVFLVHFHICLVFSLLCCLWLVNTDATTISMVTCSLFCICLRMIARTFNIILLLCYIAGMRYAIIWVYCWHTYYVYMVRFIRFYIFFYLFIYLLLVIFVKNLNLCVIHVKTCSFVTNVLLNYYEKKKLPNWIRKNRLA